MELCFVLCKFLIWPEGLICALVAQHNTTHLARLRTLVGAPRAQAATWAWAGNLALPCCPLGLEAVW
jgi:hypothetical protein